MSNNIKDDIYFKVARVISEQLNINEDKVTNNISFDNLGADSLDQIEILMKVEELFNIEIGDDEAEKFIHVKDMVEYLNNVPRD